MNEQNLVGSVINERYELLENIGSGGMALVYKANDRLLNRTVAVKILKDSLKNDTEVIEKFASEGKAAASLAHNNIVAVYDVGTVDEVSFIVMEYVDGITLKEYINNNKPIEWKKASEITIQIATALKVAHEHGIVHRDVKPHNILITKDNVAKVTDFGIASAVGSDTVVAGGTAMGSVHYISPEQARGGYVDNTSDIYSLGVVLYEMLTGVLPFDGDNAVSIALKKLEQEPVNPKVINLDIPQELDVVVMKAISKEQHIRYKTAEEFSDDLKNLINGDRARAEEITARIEREALENERKKPKKKSGFNPIIASVVLFFIIAFSVYGVMNYGGKEYTVPDLVELSIDEAIKTAEKKGFTVEAEDIKYEKSEIVEEGRVISQTPLGNKKVKRDKTIDLVVSLGLADGEIKVPDLRNLEITQAIELLDRMGLGYEVKYEENDDYDEGHVMKQSPEGDSMVNEGFKVIVYVAKTVEKEPEKSEEPKETKEPEETENPEPTEFLEPIQTPEQTPEQIPQQTNEQTPQPNEIKTKTLSIILPDGYGDSIQVKVYANGKEIYNKNHQKSEGKIDIPVKSSKDAEVQVYMNEDLVVHKIIKFD